MKKKIQMRFLDQLRDIQDSVHELQEKIDGIFDEYEVPVRMKEIQAYLKENPSTKISTSWLQSRYRMGYARAAKLMDQLSSKRS